MRIILNTLARSLPPTMRYFLPLNTNTKHTWPKTVCCNGSQHTRRGMNACVSVCSRVCVYLFVVVTATTSALTNTSVCCITRDHWPLSKCSQCPGCFYVCMRFVYVSDCDCYDWSSDRGWCLRSNRVHAHVCCYSVLRVCGILCSRSSMHSACVCALYFSQFPFFADCLPCFQTSCMFNKSARCRLGVPCYSKERQQNVL